ncbi:MAG: 50S ribosomal protein L13 [Bdellovibrionales bacterium]
MKTYVAKPGEIERKWYVVDATDKSIGRLATQVATVLRGKHKPQYTSHVDTGDFVVVINAEKVKMSGKKWTDKMYYSHTGYFGGLKEITAEKQRDKDASEIVRLAVQGMLPKSKLGKQQLKKLKAYNGTEHPHDAQQVQALSV